MAAGAPLGMMALFAVTAVVYSAAWPHLVRRLSAQREKLVEELG